MANYNYNENYMNSLYGGRYGAQNPNAGYNAGQVQNAGFYFVQNESEGRAFPLAPGNSVILKDMSSPYLYVKTMYSPMDSPKFEKYRLLKEDEKTDTADAVSRADFDQLAAEVLTMKEYLAKCKKLTEDDAK